MTNRPCVLIPSYNNPRTLADVVRGAAQHEFVIVVDDGSTDKTPEILRGLAEELDNLTVVTHEKNVGKGAALATGFEHAHRAGFTHAITMDSDGQHLPTDVPLFLAALEREPETLWLGNRDLKANGAGLGSRFGCRFSNFWTMVQTGHILPDTQTGFRCYPLEGILQLFLNTVRYDFEIEVVVKASWTGIALDSVPIQVRYFAGEDRVSHMRPVLDFLRISWLNTKLCTKRVCFPLPYLGLRALRRFQELGLRERIRQSFLELFVREPGSPQRIASSVGLGLFMGIAPFWGLQIAMTILLSHLLNVSKTIAVIASNISFPLMIPPILYGSLVLGRFALGDETTVADCWSMQIASSDFWPWVLGSFLLAAIVAAVGSVLTLLLITSVQHFKKRRTIA